MIAGDWMVWRKTQFIFYFFRVAKEIKEGVVKKIAKISKEPLLLPKTTEKRGKASFPLFFLLFCVLCLDYYMISNHRRH